MGKKKVVELSAEQRAELEKGYRKGKSHVFRERCQMILLKKKIRQIFNQIGLEYKIRFHQMMV